MIEIERKGMHIKKQILCQKASLLIEKYRDDLISITQSLVRIPSVNPPGEYQKITQCMFDLYRSEGLETFQISASDKQIHAMNLTTPRTNVIAKIPGKESHPAVLIDAHMDVVKTGDESLWRYPPFSGALVGDTIYGRGAEDTKAHLAIQIIIARVIREMSLDLVCDCLLSATVDDEIGAWTGMGFLLDEGFEKCGLPKPQFHIAGEPTGIENIGCLARGRLWYEILLKGKSAHGGNPKSGINAIEKALKLARAVQKYDRQSDHLMGSDTINIGMIHGGEAINIVPAGCKITFDIRPCTETDRVKKFMDTTITRLSNEDKEFVVEKIVLHNDRKTGGIGPDHPFVQTVQRVVENILGKRAKPTGDMAGYSSLGNAYWSSLHGLAGIMYGGGDFNRAHKVDEYITVNELIETAKVFMGIVIEQCCE